MWNWRSGLGKRKGSSKLAEQIKATLCPGMSLPSEIELLFEWIELHGHFIDTANGRLGYLFSEQEMKAGWTPGGRPGGTDISFAPEGNANLRYWFRTDDPEIMSRLCVFAKTGAEGSTAAFWLANDGTQKIVHLGSGSGSTLLCILADKPIDFLRLIAIGYDEICWGDAYTCSPSENEEFLVTPNTIFREWVTSTFSVAIPDRASEIVKYPVSVDAKSSPDLFWQWVWDRLK
ncbi:MAG: hypothetical protein JWN66_3868 [Sphingomonas bacterium]|uniref:hypothetical protein n=1 Tax=Sphingomonas bacterium TaxID=1895847 RepID=UPI00261DED99|nr:hypothetical protein [Sphingomonas bacterium]MDB5706752.1 hypothetical protein [Sphingomonas bacterium]